MSIQCLNSMKGENNMKFEAPVVEVKKFDVMDVLTISGETESTGEQTAAIYGLEDCGPL